MNAQLDQATDFERATIRDLPEILTVERGAYPFPWSETNFSDCLASGYDVWVIRGARRFLGHSVLSAAAGEAHLLNITVHADYQRQGLGQNLLTFNLQRARQLGAITLFLELRASNEQAYRLYARNGFNEIGIRRHYYPGEKIREDAIIMAIEL